MTTLLISDLHLDADTPEIANGFFAYLDDHARNADVLYILGDFFEAWIGDDILDHPGMAPLAERVAGALRRVSDGGTKLYLMHGNRDFLLGERFAADAGLTLLDEPSVVELGGERVLLMHGDSLCTRDTAYMAFREQARNPQWQAQVLAMPIEQRLELAKSLRMQSGEAVSNKAEDIMDVTPEEVVRVMEEHDVHTLIHGHTHRPAVHTLEVNGAPASRIVLGDWRPGRGWEVRVEDGRSPKLQDFPLHG
ncbi:UDP-2,3-diacylglucosamine hydrolase [Litchfieldella qijiaojingensis]|uniref:UDP-2,3-diacylglucosamine hydrolase n=1 Tax=Litchfieldella qijiaojingensis TaxID=980347 RepID=A0ABQ2YBW7_9GAMM|nr:UDP-2,3-diacylglucosamine diphosphatase [Halomonas qijiaojingensis]GGX78251.1 UDP-2,3-diacylglucosamine hydrolase [Halomonas qijiaojingensis]